MKRTAVIRTSFYLVTFLPVRATYFSKKIFYSNPPGACGGQTLNLFRVHFDLLKLFTNAWTFSWRFVGLSSLKILTFLLYCPYTAGVFQRKKFDSIYCPTVQYCIVPILQEYFHDKYIDSVFFVFTVLLYCIVPILQEYFHDNYIDSVFFVYTVLPSCIVPILQEYFHVKYIDSVFFVYTC